MRTHQQSAPPSRMRHHRNLNSATHTQKPSFIKPQTVMSFALLDVMRYIFLMLDYVVGYVFTCDVIVYK